MERQCDADTAKALREHMRFVEIGIAQHRQRAGARAAGSTVQGKPHCWATETRTASTSLPGQYRTWRGGSRVSTGQGTAVHESVLDMVQRVLSEYWTCLSCTGPGVVGPNSVLGMAWQVPESVLDMA
eukprot:3112553-Rhodomonas_salina.11